MAVLENFQSAAVRHGRKYQQRIHNFFDSEDDLRLDPMTIKSIQEDNRKHGLKLHVATSF